MDSREQFIQIRGLIQGMNYLGNNLAFRLHPSQ